MDTRPKSVSKAKCVMKLAPVSVNPRTVHKIVPSLLTSGPFREICPAKKTKAKKPP